MHKITMPPSAYFVRHTPSIAKSEHFHHKFSAVESFASISAPHPQLWGPGSTSITWTISCPVLHNVTCATHPWTAGPLLPKIHSLHLDLPPAESYVEAECLEIINRNWPALILQWMIRTKWFLEPRNPLSWLLEPIRGPHTASLRTSQLFRDHSAKLSCVQAAPMRLEPCVRPLAMDQIWFLAFVTT